MFKHFDDRNEYKNKFEYINRMFDAFRMNVTEINIDFKKMSKYYHQIAPVLFTYGKECWCDGDYRIYISRICVIFRNCKKISVVYNKFDMPDMTVWAKEFLLDLEEAAKYTKTSGKRSHARFDDLKINVQNLNVMEKYGKRW